MKQTARKLLSLVMAFAIMLTLAPVALADAPEGVSATISASDVQLSNGSASISPSVSLSGDNASQYTITGYNWTASGCGANVTNGNTDSPSIVVTSTGPCTINCSVTVTKTGTSDTATFNATEKSVTVSAAPAVPSVTRVDLSASSLEFTVGTTGEQSVEATVVGENLTDADKGVTWSLSSSYVELTTAATANPAKVQLKTGVTAPATEQTATLTATSTKDSSKSASCTIKIKAAVTTTAAITPANATVEVGKTTTLTVTPTPSSATYDSVEWTITSGTGSVNETSKTTTGENKNTLTLTGRTAGNVSVSAVLKNGSTIVATASAVTVTVTPPQVSGTIIPSTTTPTSGGEITFTFTANEATKSNLSSGDKVVWSSDNTSILKFTTNNATFTGETSSAVSANVISSGTVTVTANIQDTSGNSKGTVTRQITVSGPLTIQSNRTNGTLNNPGDYLTLSAFFNSTVATNAALTWTVTSGGTNVSVEKNYDNTATVTAKSTATNNSTATIRATYNYNRETFTADYTVKISNSAQITPSVTVYDSNSGYALTDTPDEGNTGSIADQIESAVRRQLGSSYSYNYYYTVEFNDTGNSSNRNGYLSASTRNAYYSEDLDEVVFEPTANLTSASSTAEASYGFTVRVYRNSNNTPEATYTGLMTFKIKQGTSGGDISYVASLGENVYFDVSDFEDFWNGTNRNTLDYVTFSSPSGGSLYNSSNKNTSSTPCYVDPTSRQTGLDGVYFSPNSTTSKKATTIRISFTAYGKSSGSKNGVVVITYLNKSASDITYSTNANGTVSLKASDFTAAYREATGSTAPSNMTIVFQGVPTYGSLTYLDSSKSNSKEVKLTNSNIKSRSFTTRTSGTNQLEDVTYTGSGTRSDTIEYIAYSGSTAQFSGKVVFNTVTAPTDVRVVLPTCTLSTGVALPPSYFTNANTAMSNASYVIFSGSPRLGRLSYANGSVTTAIPVNMLASVTYIPTGTNGTDSFNFTAYNSSNVVVASGTVNVVVALSTTSGGVSNINQFTDVAANAYYRTYLSDLISRGVIKGTGSGKFDPEGTLDYSQALKFILNAAGYVVPELEGANWALNYKTLAVQNGWLSSNVVLTNPISREAMAELAAKALGIGSSSAASPFSDTTNPYAVALYNTTPKIIRGQDSSAKPAFKPNDTLKRHEMVSLVYNMYQYKAANP